MSCKNIKTPPALQRNIFLAMLIFAASIQPQIGLAETRLKRSSEMSSSEQTGSEFQAEDVGWSQINEQVDMVVPQVVDHLRKLGIQYLTLANLNESISVMPLFIKYEVGLFLSNGIAYNIAGISRYGDAFMTYLYQEKSFICGLNIVIRNLQFDYDLLLRLTPFDGYGKVTGHLDNVVIRVELAIDVIDLYLKLKDFRILRFENIHVELDQRRIIRQLTGAILSPITNLFRDRITTSISDGLKEQMQILMDDFNGSDPLELRKFAQKLLASLINTGKD